MRLKDFAKSELNKVSITYQGEKIKFNLFEEVRISEANIDKELKEQPSYYGFLLMLHARLLTNFEDLKVERKKVWGTLTLQGKSKMQEGTSRPYTEEMVKAWVDKHPKYIKASSDCIDARKDADVIKACVKAFEQRKDIMQTLSSNRRSERFN